MRDVTNNWEFFYSRRSDADASIIVNLGAKQIAPDPDRRWRLTVRVKLQHPTPKGMNTAEEREALDAISDALEERLSTSCKAMFVGRMVRDGYWIFAYYAAAEHGLIESVDQVMGAFRGYRYGRDVAEDDTWSVYLDVLCPTVREMQFIMDRKVVDNLKKNGDDLSASREVVHWVYFENAFDRSKFLDALRRDGFTSLESELADDGKRTHRYCVQLRRVDYVDLGSIADLSLSLFDQAKEHNGNYDGWETQILKSRDDR